MLGKGSARNQLVAQIAAAAVVLACIGCGKDSYITATPGPDATVEFGDGIELIAPGDTLIHWFEDFEPITYQNRPALRLRELVGDELVAQPELYGYRLIGIDGFYANMPGKGYGDNTWEQLLIGYLDLSDFRVIFETERDPNLRKGHNVKWLIRVELLRSIDVDWGAARKLAPIAELEATTLPAGYDAEGEPAVPLTAVVSYSLPDDLTPEGFQYRVSARSGAGLPRLLTWAELETAYYLLSEDRVVLPAALGSAYALEEPWRIRLEGGGE